MRLCNNNHDEVCYECLCCPVCCAMEEAELDKEARAHEWETEKMELASRFDFEQEEIDELNETIAEYEMSIDSLKERTDND